MSKRSLREKMWGIKLALPTFKKSTPGFKFKYVNLEEIESALIPLLSENKLAIEHRTLVDNGNNVLNTTVFDFESEDSTSVELKIPDNIQLSGMNGYQALGSGLTYFRRYNIVTLFDILGTDNDIDALKPLKTPQKVNYVDKINSLIKLGRKKANLERYFEQYSEKMTDEEREQVIELIRNVK